MAALSPTEPGAVLPGRHGSQWRREGLQALAGVLAGLGVQLHGRIEVTALRPLTCGFVVPALAVSVLWLCARRREPRPLSLCPSWLPLLALVALAVWQAGTQPAAEAAHSILYAAKLAKLVALGLLFASFPNGSSLRHWLLVGFAGGGTLLAMLSWLDLSRWAEFSGRAVADGMRPNEFGYLCAAASVSAVCLVLWPRPGGRRRLALVSAGVTACMAVCSGAHNAVLALAAGWLSAISLQLLARSRRSVKLLAGSAVMVATLCAGSAMIGSPGAALAERVGLHTETAAARVAIWHYACREVAAEGWYGLGPGSWKARLAADPFTSFGFPGALRRQAAMASTHNTLVAAMCEWGPLGLALLGAVVVLAGLNAVAEDDSRRQRGGDRARLPLLATVLAASLGENLLYREVFWLVLGVAATRREV